MLLSIIIVFPSLMSKFYCNSPETASIQFVALGHTDLFRHVNGKGGILHTLRATSGVMDKNVRGCKVLIFRDSVLISHDKEKQYWVRQILWATAPWACQTFGVDF